MVYNKRKGQLHGCPCFELQLLICPCFFHFARLPLFFKPEATACPIAWMLLFWTLTTHLPLFFHFERLPLFFKLEAMALPLLHLWSVMVLSQDWKDTFALASLPLFLNEFANMDLLRLFGLHCCQILSGFKYISSYSWHLS